MFLIVFDRLGRLLSVFHSGLCQGDRKMYSRTFLLVFYLGWLAAPLIQFLIDFVVSLLRGTPILAEGIGVARAVVGAVAWCLFFGFSSNCESVSLLVTRLG